MHQRKNRSAYHLHGIRVLLFGVLLLAVFVVKVDPSGLSAIRSSGDVLAYATSMNRGDLLAGTNSARSQNGLGALSLDGQLNNAAQAKAQHMIDNNYWAHVAPDGTQPWYFFDQAGYAYRAAGENLAYGFMSSQAAIDGWMNSPSHRANILGDYADVGFGIANGPSYQGGQNTVVVAHYGTRQGASSAPSAPAAAPTNMTPTLTPPNNAPSTNNTGSNTPATPLNETPSDPAPSGDTTETTTAEADVAVPATNSVDNAAAVPAPVASASARGVNVLEGLKLGNIPPLAIASITLTVMSAIGFAVTHRSLVAHAVTTGERYVVRHPMLDMSVIAVACVLILTTTISRIS